MLQPLRLKPIVVDYHGYVPAPVRPLLDAAAKGGDLVPVVDAITKNFGFDTFNCGVSMNLRPDGETLLYVFTTMPAEWVAIYDQRSYIEIDPRVQNLLRTPLPFVWDQESLHGKSPQVDEFLATGQRYGLASGIAVGFADMRGHAVMIALNSKIPKLDAVRKAEIFRDIADIMLFAHFFHEMFVTGIIEQGIPPLSHGAPLSRRERECLSMAAHGLTSEDIAAKLAISPRTVQFHFDSIRSKLNAANRQEAVALGTQMGLISAA